MDDAKLLLDFGDLVIKNCHVITKDNHLRRHVLDGYGRKSVEHKSHARGDWDVATSVPGAIASLHCLPSFNEEQP